MKSTSSSWLTILITAIVGVLLIIWHQKLDVLSWVMIAVGVMFVVPSVYNLIAAFAQRKRDTQLPATQGSTGRGSTVLASIGGIALGIWMIVNPGFFVGLTAYLFAIILIAYGVFQMLLVGYWSRPYKLPAFFYIVPILLIAGGVVILCTSVRTMNSVVVLVTGILLVASAINWALEISTTHPAGTRGENAA
ncbi:MAG: DUF308 domain-containing protein [Muribaculaceae bacterium]|nr:DUF308 domain-containing protein [Muribaculaceae bacterium]